MMRRNMLAAGAVTVLLVLMTGLSGCNPVKNANVELDSSKTVHPKTPEEIKKIQDNPNIPPHIKAMMLGRAGGPPMGRKGGPSH